MGVLDTVKDVTRLVQQLDNIELVKTILQLQSQCYELVFENRELREKLIKAEETAQLRDALQFRDNAYWLGDGSAEDHGPFCSTCWDTKRVTVRMHRSAKGTAFCDHCKRRAQVWPRPKERPIQPRPRGTGWTRDF